VKRLVSVPPFGLMRGRVEEVQALHPPSLTSAKKSILVNATQDVIVTGKDPIGFLR